MGRLAERLRVARRAHATLEDVLRKPETAEIRDAAIKRFEYTFEALWRAAQNFLQDRHGIDLASPKAVIRSCRETGLLTDEEARLAMDMVADRNLTAHTYNENLAQIIYDRLTPYSSLMDSWIAKMSSE